MVMCQVLLNLASMPSSFLDIALVSVATHTKKKKKKREKKKIKKVKYLLEIHIMNVTNNQ